MEAVAWKRPKVSKAVDRRVVVNPGQARELLTAVTYVGGTSVLAVVAFALSSPVCTTRAFVPARHLVYGLQTVTCRGRAGARSWCGRLGRRPGGVGPILGRLMIGAA